MILISEVPGGIQNLFLLNILYFIIFVFCISGIGSEPRVS